MSVDDKAFKNGKTGDFFRIKLEVSLKKNIQKILRHK